MARRRMPRVNEQLKREISELIRTEARDPRIGVATVTAVSAAPDLSFARVFVAVPGPDEEREQTLAGLAAAAPWIRGELGRRLHVRRVPELRFELDTSLDYALRIERLLKEVRPAGSAGPASRSQPSEPSGEEADDGDDSAED
jgi:ribosome-binding factor A